METLTRSSTSDFELETVTIHHSLKGALFYCVPLIGVIVAMIAMMRYLEIENSETTPMPIIVGFIILCIVGLHIAKHLLKDSGKVALTIGREGVKFDRYQLITWQDIEDVYFVENDNGADTLWLQVKKGVNFFPEGPYPLKLLPFIWLAKITGLHRCIDISGYGALSMPDKDIQELLEIWMKKYTS